MIRLALLGVLLVALPARAQMAGYLYDQVMNPNIIRQAGSDAASGNLRMNNIELDNTRIGGRAAPAPSAQDIAREIRRQEAAERAAAEQLRISTMQSRVRARIATEFDQEFGKR